MNSNSKFPHDRVVFFSDAVFAIAITLLVIEIKVPTHEEIKLHGVGGSLAHIVPLFIGYFVSFIVTGLFWKMHLEIGQLVKSFTTGLIWVNTLLLLFVGLMPFTTALYSENFANNEAFSFYCLNLTAIGFMSFLFVHLVRKKENLDSILGKWPSRWLTLRTSIVPIVFALCILLAQWLPLFSRYAFILIFVFQIIGRRFFKRKAIGAGETLS
jgi:uncharacterized membrane protein